MASVNSTRRRRSGTRKIFANFSSIGKSNLAFSRLDLCRSRSSQVAFFLKKRPPGTTPKRHQKSANAINALAERYARGQGIRDNTLGDQNCLAAGFLDLLLSSLRELVRMHGNCRAQLAVPQNLQQLIATLQQTLGLERLQRQFLLIQFPQPIQIQHRVFSPENVRKPALRQPALQRHLAAFKSTHQARARTRSLSLVPTRRRLAVARTHSAPNALPVPIRLLRRPQIR